MPKGRVVAVTGALVAAIAIVAVVTYVSMQPSTPALTAASPVPTYKPLFSASTPTGPVFTMRGGLSLLAAKGATDLQPGAACRGTGMYSDINKGRPVKVFDTVGKLLTTGYLEQGKFTMTEFGSCSFEFTVTDVPDGALNYGVEFGKHGVREYTSAEAHSWVGFSDGSF
jgi:hypothetical protein